MDRRWSPRRHRTGLGVRRRRGGPSSAPNIDARWIDEQQSFIELLEEISEQPVLAIDTEFHRERTYFPKLALIQIAWGDERALVDPLAVDVSDLAGVLEGPSTVVMHAASQDLEVLWLACGALPRELFDTQIAAAFLAQGMAGLSVLVDRYFDVVLPKGDRLTDWLQRPLGDNQRRYAAADVYYLLDLHSRLRHELEEAGRLDWVRAECELLRRRGSGERDPVDAWRRIKEARSLKGEAAGVARAVAAWRERRAAEVDRPVRHVLSDLAVIGIAQRRPADAGALASIRGIDERQAHGSLGEQLITAVQEGREDPAPIRTVRGPELDRRLKPAVPLVSAWVSQLARDLSIETSMVATRADIEMLLAGDPDARLAQGWRAELVGEPIRKLVDGDAALAFDGDEGLVLESREFG